MSNISIEVEFLVGTTLEDAVVEAKQKAQEWGVAFIRFNFNDTKISVSQKTNVRRIQEQYLESRNVKGKT